MKFKHTVSFALVFTAVLGLYAVQERRESAKSEANRKTTEDFQVRVEEKMPEIKISEKVNLIQVQDMSKEETFWLEKEDSVWKMAFPVRSAADQTLAQGMAGMVMLAIKAKLMRPEGGWDEYGLDKPEFKIGVGTNQNEERHFLYLGKEAPLGGGIFARWDDKQAYFLLPAEVKKAFSKSVYEVRDKRVFTTPVTKIDRVFMEIGGKTFDMILRSGGWYWMEPIDLLGQRVANEQILAVLAAIARLHIKTFLDDSDRDVYSAGVTLISDRIQVRAGSQAETIYLGNEESLKTAYYAHRENEKSLFLIDQTKVFEILDLLQALDQANHPAAKPDEKPAAVPEKAAAA